MLFQFCSTGSELLLIRLRITVTPSKLSRLHGYTPVPYHSSADLRRDGEIAGTSRDQMLRMTGLALSTQKIVLETASDSPAGSGLCFMPIVQAHWRQAQ